MERKKEYVSKAFEDRIQISLANISHSPTDKFEIVNVQYIRDTFKCQLCDHEPCLWAYTIRNLETSAELTIGSECINHFKEELDIDLALGLKKRIKSVVRRMRKYMKKALTDEYKELAKEEKRDFICKLFMEYQLKESLRDENTKKTKLTKEEVLRIIGKDVEVDS